MPSRDQQFGWLVLVSLLAHMVMIFLLAPRMSTPSRRYYAPPAQIVRLVSFGARATEPPSSRPAAAPKQAVVAPKPKPPEKPRPKTPAPVKAVAPIPKPEQAKPKPDAPAPPIQAPPIQPTPKASDKILPEASGKIPPQAVEKPVAAPPVPSAIPLNPKPVIPPADNGRGNEISEADRLSRIQQLEKRRKLRESALAEKQAEPSHTTASPTASPAAPVVSAEEMAVYQGIITHRVRQRWVFTGGGENLSAEVLIALDRNGSVRTQKITRGSGNVEFDRSVLRAIAKASPFPSPPEGAVTEIQFRFRSEED